MWIEELERLAALKEKGLITDDEFNTKKKQLLAGGQQATDSPPRGAGTYASYAEVPFYRKNWFAILCFFTCCSPVLLLILLSGDVYYEHEGDGRLTTYSTGARVFLILWLLMSLLVFLPIFRGYRF